MDNSTDPTPGAVRYLHYGGFTIGNSIVGREADDEAVKNDWSFISTAVQLYKATSEYKVPVQEFELEPLRFASQGVKASRDDFRTSLFESIVIDSLGFTCLNTAPAGFMREALPAGYIPIKTRHANRGAVIDS